MSQTLKLTCGPHAWSKFQLLTEDGRDLANDLQVQSIRYDLTAEAKGILTLTIGNVRMEGVRTFADSVRLIEAIKNAPEIEELKP